MPTFKEFYSWQNPIYAPLRDPARAVIAAYQDANRFYDTVQEFVYIELGMVFLSRFIHARAHDFPKKFDRFIEMLHEHHLMGEYPPTGELDFKRELQSVEDVFSVLIRVLDHIQEALERFHAQTDNEKLRPMAIFTEELMMENSRERTRILSIWNRFSSDPGSLSSFDSWIQKSICEKEDD